ncbi:MAG TPA: hypothetical protein VJT75_12415 [Thermoleophilaceae bacterium]|nr:hypothetical protein [Thermoleophilaceae bacterium]
MARRLASLVLAALTVPAGAAHAAYTGTVDVDQRRASLTGSGPVVVTTGGGAFHHGAIGAGFASDRDFDSVKPGDQTVGDRDGWQLNVSGGGHDSLELREGEPTDPVAFGFGHTFFPGGVPCVVRDPNDRHGATAFSLHPDEEAQLCYPDGIDRVTVRGGAHEDQFGVLDTEAGIPIRLFGGAGGDSATESSNVPSGVGIPHNPLSAVSFSGGPGGDLVTFNDGPGKKRAGYAIEDGRVKKTPGPPALSFDGAETVWLYPQDGPSDIDIGRTGGAIVQVFGDFFGQRGPDRIDARGADGPVVVTGSTGNDTILGGPFFDSLAGGGGKDAIDARDQASDRVECDGGNGSVRVDRLDTVVRCPTAKRSAPLLALWKARFAPRTAAPGTKLHLSASSTARGRVRLTFRRRKDGKLVRDGTAEVGLKLGPNAVAVGPKVERDGQKRTLPKGRYSVKAQLRRGDARSKTVVLALTIG